MQLVFGIAIGLFVGWIFLPRPQFVDDLLAKYWPAYKID